MLPLLRPGWASLSVSYDGHLALSRGVVLLSFDVALLLLLLVKARSYASRTRAHTDTHAHASRMTRMTRAAQCMAALGCGALAGYDAVALGLATTPTAGAYVYVHAGACALAAAAVVGTDTPLRHGVTRGVACVMIVLTAAALVQSGAQRLSASCADAGLAARDIVTGVLALLFAASHVQGVAHSPATAPAGAASCAASPASLLDRYSRAWGSAAFATLGFLDELFITGERRQLALDDVDGMPPTAETREWADRLWAQLEHESARARRGQDTAWLLAALGALFGRRWLLLGVLQAVSVALSFCGPLLLNALLSYLDAPDTDVNASAWMGLLWAALMAAGAVLSALVSTHFNAFALVVQLQLRAGIIGAVFRGMLGAPAQRMACTSSGQLVNFVSVDVQKLMDAVTSVHQFWSLPVQVGITLYLMYTQVRWACLAGLGILLVFTPINMVVSKRIGTLTGDMMTHRDERVRRTGELLSGMRVVKMHAWEMPLMQRLHVTRALEMRCLRARKYLDAVCVLLWASTPPLVSLATFATVVFTSPASGSAHAALSSASVFTTVSLLNMLIFPMNAFPWVVTGVLEAGVSLRRLQAFFSGALRDAQSAATAPLLDAPAHALLEISGEWSFWPPNEPSAKPGAEPLADDDSSRAQLHIARSMPLQVRQGQIVVIGGRVGAGKTALLQAVLGNMSGDASDRVLRTSISYAPQAPWLFTGTLRDNIVHCEPWDAERFARVVAACALEPDLAALPQGDASAVSATTLSGGQRQRVSLARALYAPGRLVLLDDVLSALDARVARHVWVRAISSRTERFAPSPAQEHPWADFDAGRVSFLEAEGRAVVVVTHDRRRWADADVCVLLSDGKVVFMGDAEGACTHASSAPAHALELESVRMPDADTLSLEPGGASQITPAASEAHAPPADVTPQHARGEARAVGHVSRQVILQYLVAAGVATCTIVAVSLTAMQLTRNGTDWWLSVWSAVDSNDSGGAGGMNPNAALAQQLNAWSDRELLMVLGSIVAANAAFTAVRAVAFARAGLRACATVHDALLHAVVHAPMSFHDITPAGQLLNRFSADQYSTDELLPFQLNILLAQTWGIAGTLLVLVFATSGIFLIAIPFIALLYFRLQARYRATSRELKRLDSVTRSPLYTHFSDCAVGRDVIRAHGSVDARSRDAGEFEFARSVQFSDANQRTSWSSGLAAQWLGLRLQLLGAGVQALVAFAAVLMHILSDPGRAAAGDDAGCYAPTGAHLPSSLPCAARLHDAGGGSSAGAAGLALSYSIPVVGALQGLIGAFTETEKEMVAVERAMEYMDLEPEAGVHSTSRTAHEPYKPRAAMHTRNAMRAASDVERQLLETHDLDDTSADGHEGEAQETWSPRTGALHVTGLTLTYPGSTVPALVDVSLDVHAGEMLGVCGRTGSGKSSLIAALFRLVRWQHGRVCVDGTDITRVPLQRLREQLSIIPQDPLLFSGTVRSNLDPLSRHTDEELHGVLRECGLSGRAAGTTLAGQPKAVHTLLDASVEEGGRNWSLGERQILCLARALLKRSVLVCVDEPTASTDADTEHRISHVLTRAFEGATLVIIAHRISTLMRCDRVAVMDAGRIIELGHPRALATQAGAFAQLYAAAGLHPHAT